MKKPIQWKRFEMLELIGAGGMAQVWKAYDTETGALVAVKTLRPDLIRAKDLARFRREVELLAAVKHPNVTRVVAVYPGRQAAYAMEYCPDGDLSTWMSKAPRNVEEKISAWKAICSGVAALHHSENRIVHRDLKPGNVLLGSDRRFKISDLGLSVSLTSEGTRITTSNWVSPGFSPPEQYADMRNVTEAGDIYSLGAILLFMLTGRDAEGRIDLDSEAIPDGIRTLLRAMLARQVEDRPRSLASVELYLLFRLEAGGTSTCKCPKCGALAFAWSVPGQFVYECYECRHGGTEG